MTGTTIGIPLPLAYRRPNWGDRTSVTADLSHGGTFYFLLDAGELGSSDVLTRVDLARMSRATRLLKAAVATS